MLRVEGEREHRGRGEEERVKEERKMRADNIIRGTSPIKTTLEEDKRMRIYDTLILFLCFLGYVIMVVQVRIYTESIISPLSLSIILPLQYPPCSFQVLIGSFLSPFYS